MCGKYPYFSYRKEPHTSFKIDSPKGERALCLLNRNKPPPASVAILCQGYPAVLYAYSTVPTLQNCLTVSHRATD